MASISGNNPLSGPYSEGKELKQVCMASMTTTQHPSGAANYVEISDLTFMRGDRVIYKDVNIAIPKGKVTAIMGPSGTGKTTLLRLIGGQLKPDQGRIVVDGHNVPDLGRTELFEVRSKMGMLFQSGPLFPDLSVYENVAFPLRVHTDLPEDMIRDIVLMKLQAVGLRGASHLMPSELSGGMARRAAPARAIALDPELVMYDEPFAGQDPISMAVIVKLIKSLNESLGLTSIVVSHDVKEVLSIADYAYVIADKKVVGKGTPDELRNNETAIIKQFLNGAPDGPVAFHYSDDDFTTDLLRGKE